jgi:hypothetical protein
VESSQYLLHLGRVASVDDVLVNAVGAGLAAACSRWLVVPVVRRGAASEHERSFRPELTSG